MRVMILRIFVCSFVDITRQTFGLGMPQRVTSDIHLFEKRHEAQRLSLRIYAASRQTY